MLGIHNTDNEWRKWADHDPYYAVLSDSKYRDQHNLDAFFHSGDVHFNRIANKFDSIGIPLSRQGKAIDYGCGVGRVLRPMADYFDSVVGIDVAPMMLQEAEKNLSSQGVKLKLFDGKNINACLGKSAFAFIHTALVLQHIRPRRGLEILERLLQRLDIDGKAFVQVPVYANNKMGYLINQIVSCHPVILKLSRRILKKKRFQHDPAMQMNIYPPDQLINLFHHHKARVKCLDVKEDRKNELLISEWYLYRG